MIRSAAFATALLASGAAHAASMEYCNLYSREATRITVMAMEAPSRVLIGHDSVLFMLNHNYSVCLNQDDDPPVAGMPSDEAFIEVMIAFGAAHTASPEPAKPTPVSKAHVGRSGSSAGTAAWIKRCSAHYRSFDRKTGTVLRHRGGRRTRCPG